MKRSTLVYDVVRVERMEYQTIPLRNRYIPSRGQGSEERLKEVVDPVCRAHPLQSLAASLTSNRDTKNVVAEVMRTKKYSTIRMEYPPMFATFKADPPVPISVEILVHWVGTGEVSASEDSVCWDVYLLLAERHILRTILHQRNVIEITSVTSERLEHYGNGSI